MYSISRSILGKLKNFVSVAEPSLVDQGLHIIEALRSHTLSDTPHSVIPYLDDRSARPRGLYLTTRNTHNRQTTMIRTHIPSNPAAADQNLLPRANWDWDLLSLCL